MSMQVLVEPIENGTYRATTGSPLNITATGATPEEALEEVGRQLAEKWDRGARLYNLPGLPSVRRETLPIDPELEQLYWQAVEEHRAECDREDNRRYGIPEAPPAA